MTTKAKPEFSLHEAVLFNGFKTRIVKRYFDIDDGLYLYELAGVQSLQPQGAIYPVD